MLQDISLNSITYLMRNFFECNKKFNVKLKTPVLHILLQIVESTGEGDQLRHFSERRRRGKDGSSKEDIINFLHDAKKSGLSRKQSGSAQSLDSNFDEYLSDEVCVMCIRDMYYKYYITFYLSGHLPFPITLQHQNVTTTRI